MRGIQERVGAKMDSLIGHVSDHDIALRDRLKCQADKRLGRNSDRSSSHIVGSHRQAVDQVYKTLNSLRIFDNKQANVTLGAKTLHTLSRTIFYFDWIMILE